MYRRKLVLAFACLFGLILIQAAVVYGLFQTVQQHEKRSVAAEILRVRYTDLSTNKQRLKVWYAQLLLTQDTSAETRDVLLSKIDGHIQALRSLGVLQTGYLEESNFLPYPTGVRLIYSPSPAKPISMRVYRGFGVSTI